MEEHDYNGQKRPPRRDDVDPAAADALALGAAITICLGAVMSIGGIITALSNGYKVGAYASFAGGLTTMIIGATMVNGGIALICHRLQIKGNARTRAEVRELSRSMRAVIALLAERTEDADDQVGAARRSHEN